MEPSVQEGAGHEQAVGPDGIDRFTNGVLFLGSAGVLGLARWLEPASAGHGTHMALGLPGCSFLTYTGWPCPMCGATTSFSLLAHGELLAGLVNQPFATLLFTVVVGVLGISGAEVVAPAARWSRLGARLSGHEGTLAALALGLMGLAWALKLASFA